MLRMLTLSLMLGLAISSTTLARPVVQSPENINAFLTKFKAAVAANDKEAVASMTQLPFLYDSKPRNRAGFIKIQDQLFNAKVRRAMAKAKPLKEDDRYVLFCGDINFYFGQVDGAWKLIEFGAND